MKVDERPISTIKPYDKNPRLNDGAVDAVARSIEEFGFRQPIVVDYEGVIIVGHTRWKAAKKLDMLTVPVHVVCDMSPERIKAYRIADNKLGELATWDTPLLASELTDLQASSIDLELLGFSVDEVATIVGPEEGLVDADCIPEPPAEAETKPGDLIVLGDHRLYCGDSADELDVNRLLCKTSDTFLGGLPAFVSQYELRPVHLVNTDPPYNVRVEPTKGLRDSRGKQGRNARVGHIEHRSNAAPTRRLVGDFVSDVDFDQMLRAWFGNIARVLEPGRAFYVWGGYSNVNNYPPALRACDLCVSQIIVWDKRWPTFGARKDFMGAHESCYYGWRVGAAHVFLGPANATDVWSVKKVAPQSMVHLTEKPVELAIRAIQYSSRVGETVLDLFGGSGSTLIAAEMTGRQACLMEIDPLYCDVIAQRWKTFTGRKAKRFRS